MDTSCPPEFIAIISDMHLAPADEPADWGQHSEDIASRRARHLQEVHRQLTNGPPPAAILFGGDNANRPVDRPAYRSTAHDFMRRFPEPRFAIPGNHDVGSTVGWEEHDPNEMAEACAAFRQDWQDRWVFEAAGFRVIGINSQLFGSGLPDEREQTKWLRAQLARPTDAIQVVFAHTPPYLKGPDDDFADGSEMMCLLPPARMPLLAVLDESPPDLLITAHAHRFWICNQPRWDWLGITSTALGQDEQIDVPSHHVPPGDDRTGWVALHRQADTWAARLHPCVLERI